MPPAGGRRDYFSWPFLRPILTAAGPGGITSENMGIFGKTISIRWSLLRSFAVLILLSSLTVLMLMTIRAHQTEKDLSEKLINRGTLQATEELDRFFQPVNINALIAARWGLAGKLNLAEVVAGPAGKLTASQLAAVTRINTLLLPLMRLFPEMSSLQVANARGDGFLIIRLESGRIRNRVVSREGWGTRTLWFDLDQEGRPQSPEWQEVDYEPRSRAWYVGLKDLPDEEVFWTEPYLFFTTKDLGITASVKWHDRGLEYVFAVDILLTSITDFTRRDTTQLSKHSQTAVYTQDWRVVGLPRHEKFQDQESIRRALLLPIDEIQIPELQAAVKKAEGHKEISQQIKESGKAIFSYESQEETWWAGVTFVSLGEEAPALDRHPGPQQRSPGGHHPTPPAHSGRDPGNSPGGFGLFFSPGPILQPAPGGPGRPKPAD